jgi:hypothetical protein
MTRIGALGLAIVALGVSASLAVAAPPAGKGKPTATAESSEETAGATKGKKPVRTGEGCRPRVTVVLKGSLVEKAAETLKLDVKQANAHGRSFVGAGLVVALDAKTTFRRNGAKEADALVTGDRLLVQARVCKADLTAESAPALTAVRVVAHPPTA